MGVVALGTAPSQPSSCCDSSCPLSVYQEPAWVALRVTILVLDEFIQVVLHEESWCSIE
jgi:hypothetical protein